MKIILDGVDVTTKFDGNITLYSIGTSPITPPVIPPVVPPVTPPPTPPPQPPPAPLVGALGSKTNPIKLDKPYSMVTNGFTHSNRGVDFTIGSSAKVYFEIDPALLKASASSFQMVVKGMNCPTLWIYKAYYDKNTQAYTDDVYFTAKGTLHYVSNSPSRPFSSTKFLYVLENGGASWGIQLWVQMY